MIRVNGVNVAAGVDSAGVGLNVGVNVIQITCFAQDSSYSTTYVISVNRQPCKFIIILIDTYDVYVLKNKNETTIIDMN